MQELIKYFETLEARIVALDTRIAALEDSKQAAEARIAALEEEKQSFEARIAELEARPYVELDDEDDFVEEENEEFVEEVDEETAIEEPIKEEQKEAESTPEPEPEPEPQSELFAEEPLKEEPAAVKEEPAAVKEEPAAPKAMIYGKPVDDIRLAISLGDRFLYQRELFAQNAELMQRSLTELNKLHSFDEALTYIGRFNWDTESNTYQQFLVTLHRRFG